MDDNRALYYLVKTKYHVLIYFTFFNLARLDLRIEVS